MVATFTSVSGASYAMTSSSSAPTERAVLAPPDSDSSPAPKHELQSAMRWTMASTIAIATTDITIELAPGVLDAWAARGAGAAAAETNWEASAVHEAATVDIIEVLSRTGMIALAVSTGGQKQPGEGVYKEGIRGMQRQMEISTKKALGR